MSTAVVVGGALPGSCHCICLYVAISLPVFEGTLKASDRSLGERSGFCLSYVHNVDHSVLILIHIYTGSYKTAQE
jgi:hypothetical protein